MQFIQPPALTLQTKQEVVLSTARLVAGWQSVGFTHGVLNTDNMSILGLTIDYGPYGFLDYFDPDFIPNGSDNGGRCVFFLGLVRWRGWLLADVLSSVNRPPDRTASTRVCVCAQNRYTYSKQPEICRWNLEKFAEA